MNTNLALKNDKVLNSTNIIAYKNAQAGRSNAKMITRDDKDSQEEELENEALQKNMMGDLVIDDDEAFDEYLKSNVTSIDCTKMYLREIGNIDVKERDEQIELITKAQQGDKEALNKIIEANLRLVVSIAKSKIVKGVELDDLIQEGNLGLFKAVQKFDKTKGCAFSTYAVPWITQYITRYTMYNWRAVTIPVHTMETKYAITKCIRRLNQKLFREPTVEEIAEELGMDVDKVSNNIKLTSEMLYLSKPLSSDKVSSEDDELTLGDSMQLASDEDIENEVCMNDLNRIFEEILNDVDKNGKPKFKDIQKEIIKLRFGFYGKRYTLHEIGKKYNVSRERIRQLEDKAIKTMQNPKYIGLLECYKDQLGK